jgi:hypothetical protein
MDIYRLRDHQYVVSVLVRKVPRPTLFGHSSFSVRPSSEPAKQENHGTTRPSARKGNKTHGTISNQRIITEKKIFLMLIIIGSSLVTEDWKEER